MLCQDRRPSVSRVREAIAYFPLTGDFQWKIRPVEHFASAGHCDRWNKRYAGKRAGTPNSSGRVLLCLDSVSMKAARVAYAIMNGHWPTKDVDHKNGICSDDRWSNLRGATHAENMWNRKPLRTNTSGMRGVSLDKRTGRWKAQISINGKNVTLGHFDLPEAARLAYMSMEQTVRGQFLSS